MQPHVENPLSFLNSVMKEETFTLPCGRLCKIREITGEDEAQMSKISNIEKGQVFNYYLKCIIQEIDGQPVSDELITSLRQRSKYFIAIKSRILSYGAEMEFQHTFDKSDEVLDFEEDLNKYIQDFSKDVEPEFLETEGSVILNPKFKKEACQPYPKDYGDYVEFITSSGKTLRFQFLTGLGEKKLLEVVRDDMNLTDKLKARFLQVKDLNGNWHLVTGFKPFNGQDMKEIRTHVNFFDNEFECVSTVTHPTKGWKEQISLFSKVGDFFFPTGL